MAVFYFKYTGNLVGVNKWKDARIMKNPKYKPGMSIFKMFIVSMYKTKEYRACMDSLANAMRGVRLDGYYDLRLKISTWRRKDTDSPVKVILDALEKSFVVSNDNRIRDIIIVRAYHPQKINGVTVKDVLIVELFKPRFRETPWAGEKQISLFDK